MRIKKSIKWPDLPKLNIRDLSGTLKALEFFFEQLRKVFNERDRQIALAINAADIEIVSAAPSGAPDYGEPALKLYKESATWRIYVYTGPTDGWVYFNADG